MSYWYKPEMWRDEDVPSEYWDDFMEGQKEMKEYDQFHKSKKERIEFDEHGIIHITEKAEESLAEKNARLRKEDFDKWDYENAHVPDWTI